MSLELEQIKRIVEGALFAAGQPMKLDKIVALFPEEEAPATEILVEVLTQLRDDYRERGVMLKEVASGYRFQVQESVAPWVSRLWEEKPPRYSRALLETLALIAYRQPITRGEIEEIRGVSVSTHITKTLLEREWIRVVGHRDVPGRPAMYGTTRQFLDYFNLKNLDQLPSLAEIRDLDAINAELELVPGGREPETQNPQEAGAGTGSLAETGAGAALEAAAEAEAAQEPRAEDNVPEQQAPEPDGPVAAAQQPGAGEDADSGESTAEPAPTDAESETEPDRWS
ncbi:MAG: SMC-Scp complex subunit ScpB [Pseudomonadota bacterium]|nr:SMC-Scp complex subunit ScpB [Pseudomonadales bacterium]MDY6920682.1 SMC-Scp complex subunit ScpB [Pseudomonadota bacterium]